MDEIRDFFAEMHYDWKYNRREFVGDALGMLAIVFTVYVMLLVGSTGGAK
ncbi:hypothetical protein UFOVP570_13 [uncultured Caudovirales phage]|uniref:Uncharacterized protein n=1 Tax=uncultured Caudovirales phage TaxID=2100421 RepID=A0A6J5N324_9CAUD|nr:hypothetical protein UFOVP570_13 [uncultured Caudovirales phage]